MQKLKSGQKDNNYFFFINSETDSDCCQFFHK